MLDYNNLQVFIIKTAAVVTEALPFILLGSTVSALIHVFVSESFVKRTVPKRVLGQIVSGISLSIFLPTCECGIVPVVRKLVNKGVPAPMAASYLVAAPVINPITILSTYIGFRNSAEMTIGRILINIAASIAAGYLFSLMKNPFRSTTPPGHKCSCCDHYQHNKFHEILTHGKEEFFSTLSYLIGGAAFAAAFQTLMPSSALTLLAGSPMLSIAAMMVFAVILSVCAEADSFVASSFTHFSPASQLAFVSFGSIFDLKLLLMYQSLLRKRTIIVFIPLMAAIVFILALLSSYYLHKGTLL